MVKARRQCGSAAKYYEKQIGTTHEEKETSGRTRERERQKERHTQAQTSKTEKVTIRSYCARRVRVYLSLWAYPAANEKQVESSAVMRMSASAKEESPHILFFLCLSFCEPDQWFAGRVGLSIREGGHGGCRCTTWLLATVLMLRRQILRCFIFFFFFSNWPRWLGSASSVRVWILYRKQKKSRKFSSYVLGWYVFVLHICLFSNLVDRKVPKVWLR